MSGKIRNSIRRDYAKILSNLEARWLRAASASLCSELIKLLEEQPRDKIHSILAWTKFFPGEVDLSSFIENVRTRYPVFLPRSLPDRTMTFVSVGEHWNQGMQAGAFGIPEPDPSNTGHVFNTRDGNGALVIVPGLAFDANGFRLGRGKGYYDRFLSSPGMEGATKVGVLWRLQLVNEIPALDHDVGMDWLCFEDGFHEVERLGQSNKKMVE